MAKLLLFAQAREAAGTGYVEASISELEQLTAWCADRFGAQFLDILAMCSIWINGDPATFGRTTPIAATDEIAILPPVSGG